MMKVFIKVIKLILSLAFLLYSLGILYVFALKPKEERFKMAEHAQGSYLSQTMFEILKFQHPEDSNIYFEQSVPFNKRGDYAKGFQLLDKAVDLAPKLHLGYRGWMKLRKLRDYDGALLDFDRLDSLTPNFIDAPWGEDIDFLRGECYFGKKEFSKAISLFEKNIQNQTEDWVDVYTFVYLGLCHYELGNYTQAIYEFQRGLKQSPNMPESYFGLAKAFRNLGEIEKAKAYILKAENNMSYKREDYYNEFLNEIYLLEILELKQVLHSE